MTIREIYRGITNTIGDAINSILDFDLTTLFVIIVLLLYLYLILYAGPKKVLEIIQELKNIFYEIKETSKKKEKLELIFYGIGANLFILLLILSGYSLLIFITLFLVKN